MKEKDLDQVVIQGLKYEEIEKEKASERKALTRKYGLKLEDAKYSQNTMGQTRDIVAKKLGMSGRHWDHMKFIYNHKNNLSEQEYENWRTGKIATSNMYNKLCKDIKYIDKINTMIKSLTLMQNNIEKFKKSYIVTDVKNNLLDILSSYLRIKGNVMENFNKILMEQEEFADRQYYEILMMKQELRAIKNNLKNKVKNNK